nr:hypothetical protein [Tanacetum cinerariifolium]
DGIFCKRCTCKSCGNDAHIGYNCPSKVLVISILELYNNQTIDELPQAMPIFHLTFHSEAESPFTLDSTPTYVDESPNVFNPPPQLPVYPCEFCGNDAYFGHYCIPQPSFIYPEPCYNQDFNFPQNFQNVPQQYPCCDDCGKREEKRIEEEQAAKVQNWKFPVCYDDDDDEEGFNSLQDNIIFELPLCSAITPNEPVDSLIMENEHFDTIPATETDEVIKSSVENLILILSEFKGIPDTMCDVHLVNNPTPFEAKDQFKIVINSNDDYSSSDDDSLYYENIEYVEASPHDYLCEKLLKVNLLIAEIEALKDNPTPSSEFLTKSSSTSSKPFLEETNTSNNSLPEFENFCFDLEEISSGSTTTHSDLSLPEYEAFFFYDDHIEEISSGSTNTQSDISLPEYDSFIFDLSNDQFPPTDRSDFTHEEFSDESAHIISPPEYECFYFGNLPDSGELISSLNSGIHENLSSTTCVNLPVEDDYSPLLAYVVWIFLAYLTYPVIPPHAHSFGNEDIIFDPGITINRFYPFKPGLSHRCGTFKKFNTHRSHLNGSPMEILFSTLFPMEQ